MGDSEKIGVVDAYPGSVEGSGDNDAHQPADHRPVQPTSSPLRRLLQGSATYGLGSILQKSAWLLLVPVYTRFLTPADYGIVSVTTAVASVFSVVLGMGLHGSITRQYYDYRDRPAELREFIGTVFLFFSVSAIAIVALASLFGRALFDQLLRSVPFEPFIQVALWTAFFTASINPLLSIYRAREQPLRYVALNLTQTVLTLLGILYFVVVLKRGALGQVWGGMVGGAAVFVVVLFLISREAIPAFSTEKLSRALAFGLPLVPHLVFGWVLSVGDRILLGRMSTLEEVGLYSLGYQIGMIIGLLVSAINSAWTPIFYDTATRDPNAKSIISRVCTVYVGVVALCAAILVLAAPELLDLLSDPSYAGALRVVPWVAIGYVLQGLYFMSVTPVFYLKRTKVLPLITLLAAVANVGANLILIPAFGILGAAWATVVSFAVLFVVTHSFAQRIYPISFEYRKIGTVLALLLGIALAMDFLRELQWVTSATIRVALLGAFLIVLVEFRLVDLDMARRLIRSRRKRATSTA